MGDVRPIQTVVDWNAGAKGQKSHRVPVPPKLTTAIKRCEARQRPEKTYPNLLINRLARPYDRFGIADIMDRLQGAWASASTRPWLQAHVGPRWRPSCGGTWNTFRATMGHAVYNVLQLYVRLATERDLRGRQEWLEYVAANPHWIGRDSA